MKIKSAAAFYLLLIILTSACAVFAQDQPPQPEPLTITWKKDAPNCDMIAVDGARYRIISHNGLYIAFEFVDTGSHYTAFVYVSNSADSRILVDPDQSFLTLWKDIKKESYEMVKPTPSEKIAGKLANRARWANALRAFGAGMATTQTTTYGTTGSVTTVSPDLEARDRAERQNAQTSAEAEGRAASVMSAALRVNTLFTDQRVSGEIYFQKKKFEAGYFVFKIGDAFYRFIVRPVQK